MDKIKNLEKIGEIFSNAKEGECREVWLVVDEEDCEVCLEKLKELKVKVIDSQPKVGMILVQISRNAAECLANDIKVKDFSIEQGEPVQPETAIVSD